MDPRTLALLNQRFPSCRISQKYGTTETGSPRSASRDNNSLWLKLGGDGVEVKVVDGVLHLRSESTILGYLNAPSPIDADGWYCTGDLVDVDGEWIRFRGRSSDQINVGGEKVAPSEVEQVLLELDFVREAVVSGESNPIMGQVVAARIVLTEAVDERDAVRRIRIHCRSRLARHMIPVKVHCVSASLSTRDRKSSAPCRTEAAASTPARSVVLRHAFKVIDYAIPLVLVANASERHERAGCGRLRVRQEFVEPGPRPPAAHLAQGRRVVEIRP